MSYTEWLEQHRFTVVEVDASRRRLRLKAHGDACHDLACDQTVVVGEDGRRSAVEDLNPGDIVKLDADGGQAARVVVVRRVWDELTSPEF